MNPTPPSTCFFRRRALGVVCAAALIVSGCSKPSPDGKESADATAGEHVHIAPHGGTLVEIGDHVYNLELLRDRATGKLTAWVLDAHAENFVRIASPTIELIAMPGGQYTPVALRAVANPGTGEAVGDTSQFEAEAEWLKTAGGFAGIFTIDIKGTKFEQVAYFLPE